MTAARASAFLDALYAGLDGHVELRALPSKARMFCQPGHWQAAAQFTKQHASENVYFGVALRNTTINGTLKNCSHLPALYADVDFDHISEADARQRLADCPIRPSIMIASGGGLHVYWLLKEPLDLADDLERAEHDLQALVAYLGGDPHCAEAARVLRLPGTLNHNYSPARRVTVEMFEADRRYNLSDFDWLPEVPQAEGKNDPLTIDSEIREGKRNDTLYRLGRSLKAKGLPAATILSTLHHVNEQQCKPPLSAREVATIGDSVVGQADRPDFAPKTSDQKAEAVLTRLSTVEPIEVEWVWPRHFARGKYTMIAGDPGVGKSSMVLDCASRLSRRGSTWPDGTPAPYGTTLLLSAEDGLADTIRPRVDRFGGDADKIIVLEAVRDQAGRRPLNLARDVAILIGAIREVQPALVDIDPITAYLGRTDAHRDAEVRGLLAPLVAACEELRTAFVAIAHLNKDQTRAALHRPGGSVAFVAAARLAFVIAADPQDDDRHILACLKANLCQRPDPLAFRFDGDRLTWEDGPATGMDAEMLLRPSGPADREDQTNAERVIHDLLQDESDWPVDSKLVLEAGRAHGISESTMRRTAGRLRIRISRAGFGRGGRWLWHRPPIDAIPVTSSLPVTSMVSMTEHSEKAPIDTIEVKKSAFPRAREDGGADDGRVL